MIIYKDLLEIIENNNPYSDKESNSILASKIYEELLNETYYLIFFIRENYKNNIVGTFTRKEDDVLIYDADTIIRDYMCKEKNIHDFITKFGISECQNCGILEQKKDN